MNAARSFRDQLPAQGSDQRVELLPLLYCMTSLCFAGNCGYVERPLSHLPTIILTQFLLKTSVHNFSALAALLNKDWCDVANECPTIQMIVAKKVQNKLTGRRVS